MTSKSKEHKKISLGIVGMSCTSCAQTIEKALKEHAGVEQANVNFASEKAYLTYDPKVTNEKELIETVRTTGYDVRLETKKTIIKIGRMTCASCAQTIEKALKKTEGIIEANVNLASEKAVVVYDVQEIDYKGIKEVIESVGYEVLGIEESATKYEKEIEEEQQKFREAKTRMRVAWAFTIPIIAWMIPEMILGLVWPNEHVYNIGMILLAVPVLFWAGKETFLSAVRAVSHGSANMDVLIALGLSLIHI